MLNLIEMFSQRPAPVVGARHVRGRDMVCGEEHNQKRSHHYLAAQKTALVMQRRKGERKAAILNLLKTRPYFTRECAEKLGYSETNTGLLIKELYDEGKLTKEKRGFALYYKAKNEQA